MIDTIKVGIPLTSYQLVKLHKLLSQDEAWKWVQYQPVSGEIRFLRVKGLAHLDRKSFHRDIAWDIPDHYMPHDCCLRLELSVPKFWYGHNVHLLYNFLDALKELKKQLDRQLGCRLTNVLNWKLFRVDICYAWRCPSQQLSQQILNSLKHLHYPRKKPIIYPEAILFAGRTYSLKFYLKLPEFKQHDRKVLLKEKASLEWINHLEELATGVIRCEATLRKQYLKAKGILTIADLIKPNFRLEWSQEFIELAQDTSSNEDQLYSLFWSVMEYRAKQEGINNLSARGEFFLEYALVEGSYSIPPGSITIGGIEYNHDGGSYTIEYQDNPISILKYFIDKFIGGNLVMDTADQVESKLLEKYKPVKAARLVSMWLYVQRFGSYKAKELFGHDSYYRSKKDLKSAGISLLQPPKVINAADRFLQRFRFELPSEFVTNSIDDFRESGNILNLPKRTESK